MIRNSIRSLLVLAAAVLTAACTDDDNTPRGTLALTAQTRTLELGAGETGTVQLMVSPWKDSWNVAAPELEPVDGSSLPEGCSLAGFGSYGGGRFAVYVMDDGTGADYNTELCVRIHVGGQLLRSTPFTLRSAAEGRNGRLPVIRLTSEAPIESRTVWIAGTVEIEGNGQGDLKNSPARIKGRGNSSWKHDKKPYALKLETKTRVLGMPAHKRWCLIANYLDRTLLRNRLAYYIASHTPLLWTPRTRFAELYLNGDYLGNYLVVEQIKIGKERLDIDELTPADIAGDALTGGYLLEMDSYYDEANKFRSTRTGMPVNIKSPDEAISREQYDYIVHYFNAADELLFDRNFADFAPLFNIDSFIDFWIVNELMGNAELGHPKSFYLYKPRGGKLTAGPVWDFDYGTLTLAAAEQWSVRGNNLWLTRMLTSAAVRSRARERWQALYPFLQSVPDYIERQRTYLCESAARNGELWPEIRGDRPNGDEQLPFDEAVARLRWSYEERLAWLDSQIRSW